MARLATEIAICNRALARLGSFQITDFETPTIEEERQCLLWYDKIVERTLRSFPFNCAIKRAELVATTAPDFGFTNAFTLPTDYLMTVEEDSGYYWKIEGGVLYTDFAEINLVYVALVDADEFDSLLEEVIEIEMTIVMAQRFEQSSTMVARLVEMRESLILRNARYIHSVENEEIGEAFDDEIIRARFVGTGPYFINGKVVNPW